MYKFAFGVGQHQPQLRCWKYKGGDYNSSYRSISSPVLPYYSRANLQRNTPQCCGFGSLNVPQWMRMYSSSVNTTTRSSNAIRKTKAKTEGDSEDLAAFQRLVQQAVAKVESEPDDKLPETDKLARIAKVVDDGKPLPNTFEEIGVQLPEAIMNNLKSVGITKPTHIQSKAIPAILNGEDTLIQSHTGTGKTLAYVLPMLQFLLPEKDQKNRKPMAVIAAPTYELALQIQSVLQFLLAGLYPEDSEFATSFIHSVFDDDLPYQLRMLQQKKPVILLGTPRTLLGLLVGDESYETGKRAPNISKSIKMLVLDEPDQIIAPLSKYAPLQKLRSRQRHPKPGWTIAKHIVEQSQGVQLVCASATINRTLRGSLFAAGFSHMTLTTIGDPFRIPYHIKHRFVGYSEPSQRIQTLCTVYSERIFPKSALVFCDSSESLETLASELQSLGIKAVVLHKQMENRNLKTREAFLNAFRIGDIQMVLVSELSGRGLDFPSLEHVIIFATPRDANSYIHMAGRTGRALMKTGFVTTILPQEQVPTLAKISQYIQVKFKKLGVN